MQLPELLYDQQTPLCPQLLTVSRALAGAQGHDFLAALGGPSSFPNSVY